MSNAIFTTALAGWVGVVTASTGMALDHRPEFLSGTEKTSTGADEQEDQHSNQIGAAGTRDADDAKIRKPQGIRDAIAERASRITR